MLEVVDLVGIPIIIEVRNKTPKNLESLANKACWEVVDLVSS